MSAQNVPKVLEAKKVFRFILNQSILKQKQHSIANCAKSLLVRQMTWWNMEKLFIGLTMLRVRNAVKKFRAAVK
jgi:hypothetical protein